MKCIKKYFFNEKGFTLLELSLVLAVMGIIAAITVPPLARNLNEWKVKRDVRQLAGQLRYIQYKAVTERKIWCFEVTGWNRYELYPEEDKNQARVFNLSPGIKFKEYPLKLGLNQKNIKFKPSGESFPNTTIIIKGPGNKDGSVIIYWTGRVRVE